MYKKEQATRILDTNSVVCTDNLTQLAMCSCLGADVLAPTLNLTALTPPLALCRGGGNTRSKRATKGKRSTSIKGEGDEENEDVTKYDDDGTTRTHPTCLPPFNTHVFM